MVPTTTASVVPIREYSEGMPVTMGEVVLDTYGVKQFPHMKIGDRRLVVVAANEGGYNCTQVDLLDVLEWVGANRPDLLRTYFSRVAKLVKECK